MFFGASDCNRDGVVSSYCVCDMFGFSGYRFRITYYMYWRRSYVYEVATQQSADIKLLMYKFIMWYDTHTTIYITQFTQQSTLLNYTANNGRNIGGDRV